MFQQQLHQLKIIQNYYNILNQDSNAQLAGININQKYQTTDKKQYFNQLVDPSFQGANKLIVLLLRNAADRTSHRGYKCPKEAIETYNVKIDGRNFFDRPLTNGERTYDSA